MELELGLLGANASVEPFPTSNPLVGAAPKTSIEGRGVSAAFLAAMKDM